MSRIRQIRLLFLVFAPLPFGTWVIGYILTKGYDWNPAVAYSLFPIILVVFIGGIFALVKYGKGHKDKIDERD